MFEQLLISFKLNNFILSHFAIERFLKTRLTLVEHVHVFTLKLTHWVDALRYVWLEFYVELPSERQPEKLLIGEVISAQLKILIAIQQAVIIVVEGNLVIVSKT